MAHRIPQTFTMTGAECAIHHNAKLGDNGVGAFQTQWRIVPHNCSGKDNEAHQSMLRGGNLRIGVGGILGI